MIPKPIQAKLDEGRAYRDFDTSAFERREDNGEMIVEGYASTFNDPYLLWDDGEYRVFEQIDANAFDETDMSDVILQFDHAGRVFARMSNNTLEVKPDAVGLHIRANLGGTEIGRQLYEEIEGGYTTKMSFGFRVGEDKREVVEDRGNSKVTVYRTITKISKLYDVSAVSLPANDATSISARNFCDGLIAEIKGEFLEREKRERQKRKIKLLMEVK